MNEEIRTPVGGTVTITAEEHIKLKRNNAILAALYASGVDCWEGYDDSLKHLRKEGVL